MKSPVVVLDPGHGGRAKVGGSSPNNAQGYNGLLERDVTLDLTRRVADAMSRRVMADVRLTRAKDANLSLADRAAVARNANAEVFVSIHFNGSTDLAVDGTEAWVATQANAGSRRLAQRLSSGVATVAKVRNRGVKARDLGVLVPSRHAGGTAACLLEVAFLSNRAEADKLTQTKYLDDIALAVAQGIGDTLAGADAPTTTSVTLDEPKREITPTKRYLTCLAKHKGLADCPVIPPICIPPRPDDAPDGHAVMDLPDVKGEKEPHGKAWKAREDALFEQIVAGNIPHFLRGFRRVSLRLNDKNDVGHDVVYFVMPDYLAVGSNGDYVTAPLDGITAQRVADAFGCVLPTGKMVRQIYGKAKLRLQLRPRHYAAIVHKDEKVRNAVPAAYKAKYGGKDQDSTWAYTEYSDFMRNIIESKLAKLERPRWTLVAGYRKDVVVSKDLETDASMLVFFGGWLSETKGEPPKPLQVGRRGSGQKGPHPARYADYSHGVRLVSRRIVIDGTDRSIARVLADPVLGPMLENDAPLDLTSARYR